jgi:hypothetical protein
MGGEVHCRVQSPADPRLLAALLIVFLWIMMIMDSLIGFGSTLEESGGDRQRIQAYRLWYVAACTSYLLPRLPLSADWSPIPP